ncbi:AAA family ATPase [Micropruina sp.]|uniref:cytidylate kinase-like family protein n=1 Tax=Micropruina sp. TaxID=2737536 RepID=UPI0039E4F038
MNRSIVINREFGSGGREVGRLISERTGLGFYDTRILADAAARRGVPANQLEAFDERLAAGQYLNVSFPGFSDPEFAAMPYRVFAVIAEVITEAAKTAPGVFIGRCADSILREAKLPLLSVFVYSTDSRAKIARAVEVDGVPAKDAEKYIVRMDKTRSRYQQYFTGTHFGDHRGYDLCLNSGNLGVGACADAIVAVIGASGARFGSAARHGDQDEG